MAEKLTPKGLVVGMIPTETPQEQTQETEKAVKTTNRGRKPKAAE